MNVEGAIRDAQKRSAAIGEALKNAKPSKAAEKLHAKQNRLNILINSLIGIRP